MSAIVVSKPWIVQLICCGREDGTWPCATWAEADALRNSYVAAEGHDRAAIISIHFAGPQDGET